MVLRYSKYTLFLFCLKVFGQKQSVFGLKSHKEAYNKIHWVSKTINGDWQLIKQTSDTSFNSPQVHFNSKDSVWFYKPLKFDWHSRALIRIDDDVWENRQYEIEIDTLTNGIKSYYYFIDVKDIIPDSKFSILRGELIKLTKSELTIRNKSTGNTSHYKRAITFISPKRVEK